MKKTILLLGALAVIAVCVSCRSITSKEKSDILDADENTPFDILQTTKPEDLTFLRRNGKDIKKITHITDHEVWQHFFKRMRKTLEEADGVGLAAPQVGISRNVFLFTRIDKPGQPIEIAINPRIVSHSAQTVCFERDGCLSIPDRSGNSRRYEWVEVEYYTEKGAKIRERLSGTSRQTDFTGVIFQHEYDHLQGVLFIDKLCE